MRIVITIEDSPAPEASPPHDTSGVPPAAGTAAGIPSPMVVDSMPEPGPIAPPDVVARAMAIDAISAGPAPAAPDPATGAPPAFTPDQRSRPGPLGPPGDGDLSAGPAPDHVEPAGIEVAADEPGG